MGFDIDISVRQGTFALDVVDRSASRALGLFGPSGSGKTTVIEAIAGLRTPVRGTIIVDDQVLYSSERGVNLPPRLRRVGYVPQDTLLFPHLDVRGNVLYGRRDGATASVDEIAELLELRPLMDRKPASLSGGERQRVALARALMSSPRLLLLDEPMAAVDLARRRRILDVLQTIRDRLRLPFVYVAHAPEEVVAIADRAIVLDQGHVVAAGKPPDVLLKVKGD